MSIEATFKNIRNRIRRHKAPELLYEFLKIMNRRDALQIERLRNFPYWYLLLLTKWIIMYGDYTKTSRQIVVTEYHIIELVNRMHKLSTEVRKPTQYHNWLLFMRNMAFQQFWLQEPYTMQRISRQYQLFARLDANHVFQRLFVDCTGVSINDFIELSVVLLTHSLTQESMLLSANWFESVARAYAPQTVQKFLGAVSIDLIDARQWLLDIENEKSEKEKTIEYEFFEQSPFVRYPLIKRGDAYFCISPILLQHALHTFIYDLLRTQDAQFFMDKFGTMFENIVEDTLRLISPQLLTEADLKAHFRKMSYLNQKVVDFLVVDNGSNIFIDAKGVAMGWLGMVTHLPGTVRTYSKTSVLKGIEQAYALAQKLSSVARIENVELNHKDNFLLIVTFKDLFVSNGRNFRDRIAPDEVDKIILNSGNREWIPLTNIYIISVDDLEIMVSFAIKNNQSISEILKSAVEADKDPSRMKFAFRQHIFEQSPNVEMLPLLQNAFDELLNRVQSKFES